MNPILNFKPYGPKIHFSVVFPSARRYPEWSRGKSTTTAFQNSPFNSSLLRPDIFLVTVSLLFLVSKDELSQYSVWLQTWQAGFDTRQRQRIFFSSLCIQTSSGAHSASYAMGTGGYFPGVKRGRRVTLTTQPPLVPRSGMCRSYMSSSPCRLHGGSGTALLYWNIFPISFSFQQFNRWE
jgi:hypothetical protein